jgi:hypothetical protein
VRDKDLALQKAASLHGYQTFLTQARRLKAGNKTVPRSFEREVQAQASQAVSNARDLATATLRMTKHLKQAGHLDRMLDSWIAGVKASGPVQVQDLWSDIVNNPEARQGLRDQRLADDLFASIHENMQKLDGRIVLHEGKLAAEVKLAGQERTRRVVLAHSVSGSPRSLHDLLARGRFERIAENFERGGPLAFEAVSGPPREWEMADLLTGGAILSVQGLAQHKRQVEDTGLAVVVGGDPITVLLVATLIVATVGFFLAAIGCPDPEFEDSGNKVLCQIGQFLLLLAMALLGLALLAGAPAGLFLGEAFLGLTLLIAATISAKHSDENFSVFSPV